ncbi:hypothetical protein Patl1_10946 [Pistacia atlantica]|uniref:Uncharacterized protein n=1 Tax=Pistacia atlantica TaxID=434234 RepID=A0ACC1A400_9ROSI|nr:hypothetical protein Patl1_10946 [Pistacia atlantica]
MNSSDLLRFRLTWDGFEEQLKWDEGNKNWTEIQVEPLNDCELYNFCGNFGVCKVNSSPKCSCMEGFVPSDGEQWNMRNCFIILKIGGSSRLSNAAIISIAVVGSFFLALSLWLLWKFRGKLKGKIIIFHCHCANKSYAQSLIIIMLQEQEGRYASHGCEQE